MAAPMNISIPALKPEERIEATSALAVQAGQQAVVQMLPSFVCRDEYERDVTLLAIKEESIEAAFKVLQNALDSPIDEFEATARFRSMVCARGVRIVVYFTRLWKEAKRAGFHNRQVCVVLVTQLPNKVSSTLNKWLQEKRDNGVSDVEMREFIALVQQSLRQMGVPLDFGMREAEEKTINYCKTLEKDEVTHYKPVDTDDRWKDEPETEQEIPQVWKVRQFASERRYGRDYRGITRGFGHISCFTCWKRGHGYQKFPARICGECHKKGHDAQNCTAAGRGTSWRNNTAKGYHPWRNDVKNLGMNSHFEEKAASISVKIGNMAMGALLDTEAKVNVMDVQTMELLEVANRLRPEVGKIYGVGGTPIAVIGSVDIPVKVHGEAAHWTRVYVLEGEEQALLLGREFLKTFGRVTFDWNNGTILLGESTIEIQEQASGGDPLARARSVRQADKYNEAVVLETTKTDLTDAQQTEFVALLKEFEPLFSDKPGRTSLGEHAIDTGDAVPYKERRRRLPPQWEEEIDVQLEEMVNQKLCRPSNSPWASNVVLVTKKDGKKRFAIDYRGLNSVTKGDA